MVAVTTFSFGMLWASLKIPGPKDVVAFCHFDPRRKSTKWDHSSMSTVLDLKLWVQPNFWKRKFLLEVSQYHHFQTCISFWGLCMPLAFGLLWWLFHFAPIRRYVRDSYKTGSDLESHHLPWIEDWSCSQVLFCPLDSQQPNWFCTHVDAEFRWWMTLLATEREEWLF